MVQVKSINHLKEILNDGDTKGFIIQLNYGLRSSKCVSYDGENTFYVLNLIDDTEQELTEAQLMDENLTNIGKDIKQGAFYLES